jgi:Ni/Co efflux regulator RcnB
MPIISSGIAQSMAGAPLSERTPARAADKPASRKPRGRDQDELVVDARAVDADQGVRSVKSNDQEESREDHQEHPAYTPKGKVPKGDQSPKLDIAG